MDDIVFRTATELAQAIRSHRITSTEVVDAFLAQIAAHNPQVNAIVTLEEATVRRRAQEADDALARDEVWGPLHGVPITVKDSLETASVRTTSSFKPLAEHVPERDATVVARMKQAGAILLGKTNLPELAGDYQTHSPIFGVTNNPWNLKRTPGGSSGGEAAAIAAGLSPLGLGSDIAGSIRIPAHYCGLFGLKPTDHRVPISGHIPPLPDSVNSVRHMPVNGPLARSVADLRLCLTLVAGPDGRDTSVSPVPFQETAQRPLASLRLAWSDDFGGAPLSSETRAALARLAKDLTAAGCQVKRANPPDFDFKLAWQTYGKLYGAMVFSAMPWFVRLFMRALGPVRFKDPVFRAATRWVNASAQDYFAALSERDRLIGALEDFLSRYDGWLCPVTATPAFTHRQPNRPDLPLEVEGELVPGTLAGLAYTMPFNLTGHPAVVLPLTQSKEGLPIGVQVVGRLWDDVDLLNVAEALTEVTGSFRRPPGY